MARFESIKLCTRETMYWGGIGSRRPLHLLTRLMNFPGAALLAAAGAGDASQVHALLHQGADPGHQGQGGQTPLMAAAAAGDGESVAALLCE